MMRDILFGMKDDFAEIQYVMGMVDFGLSEERNRELNRVLNSFFLNESDRRLKEMGVKDDRLIDFLYQLNAQFTRDEINKIFDTLY